MIAEELHQITVQELADQQKFKHRIFVCSGTACLSAHSDQVQAELQNQVEEYGLGHVCAISRGGCRGLCASGPMVSVEPLGILYQGVKAEDSTAILESLNTHPVKRLECSTDVPFFSRQKKIVLEYSGKLDPERIEAYIAVGGYGALLRVLSEMTPQQVIEQITRSGLRGRGGAGYSTGLKWSTVAKAQGMHKYVICNGDEGDPGAFMDRSVMKDYSFKILEGMTIAAYAVGADQGYLYVRAEYPLAIKRLKSAIHQAQKHNLLGSSIGATAFSSKLNVSLVVLRYPSVFRLRWCSITSSIIPRTSSALSTFSGIMFSTWFGYVWCGNQ